MSIFRDLRQTESPLTYIIEVRDSGIPRVGGGHLLQESQPKNIWKLSITKLEFKYILGTGTPLGPQSKTIETSSKEKTNELVFSVP